MRHAIYQLWHDGTVRITGTPRKWARAMAKAQRLARHPYSARTQVHGTAFRSWGQLSAQEFRESVDLRGQAV